MRVLASQGRSREERKERVVEIVSGYEIRKKDRGVEKDSNTGKRASWYFRRVPITLARSASVIKVGSC